MLTLSSLTVKDLLERFLDENSDIPDSEGEAISCRFSHAAIASRVSCFNLCVLYISAMGNPMVTTSMAKIEAENHIGGMKLAFTDAMPGE